MEIHIAVFNDGRQIKRLGVDGEFVFSKLNDVLAINKQFVLVTKLPNGIFADRFQPTLHIIDFDGFAQVSQFDDQITNLVDHQIRSEIAVDLFDCFEIRNTGANAF